MLLVLWCEEERVLYDFLFENFLCKYTKWSEFPVTKTVGYTFPVKFLLRFFYNVNFWSLSAYLCVHILYERYMQAYKYQLTREHVRMAAIRWSVGPWGTFVHNIIIHQIVSSCLRLPLPPFCFVFFHVLI